MNAFEAPQTGGAPPAETARLLTATCDLALLVDAGGLVVEVARGGEDPPPPAVAAWVGQPWRRVVAAPSHIAIEALLHEAGRGLAPAAWRPVRLHDEALDEPWSFTALAQRIDRTWLLGRRQHAAAMLQQRLVDAQQALEREHRRLRDAELRFHEFFHVAADAWVVVDAATRRIVDANAAAGALLGDGSAERLRGRTFPCGVDARGAELLDEALAHARTGERGGPLRVELAGGHGEVQVALASYRHERASHHLVRMTRAALADAAAPGGSASLLLELLRAAPDAVLVTDGDGRVLWANAAFGELAQLGDVAAAVGRTLDCWLGRGGVDLWVMLANLRRHGALRFFATTLRGADGQPVDVEVAAARVPAGERTTFGFAIRDVGRRLVGDPVGRGELQRSVAQIAERIGRAPLKELLGEAVELIERIGIETALQLTRDNRAAAAQMLGLSRQSLYVKLRRFGLDGRAAAPRD
jgi:transcriptional regulator PpsR